MKLLIDIGNTRAKYILVADSSSQIIITNITTVSHSDFNDVYFDKHWLKAGQALIDQIVFSTVSDIALTQMLTRWAKKNSINITTVHPEKEQYGVSCAYSMPSNLGVDRWLALVGAHSLHPDKNVLIIDAGTAMTIDLLAKNGVHQGGWIVPGVDLLYKTLMMNTANIKAGEINTLNTHFGTDSTLCVNNGIWAMTMSTIHQAIREAELKLTIDHILFCGGNGKALADLVNDSKVILLEELVFKGLQLYITD